MTVRRRKPAAPKVDPHKLIDVRMKSLDLARSLAPFGYPSGSFGGSMTRQPTAGEVIAVAREFYKYITEEQAK